MTVGWELLSTYTSVLFWCSHFDSHFKELSAWWNRACQQINNLYPTSRFTPYLVNFRWQAIWCFALFTYVMKRVANYIRFLYGPCIRVHGPCTQPVSTAVYQPCTHVDDRVHCRVRAVYTKQQLSNRLIVTGNRINIEIFLYMWRTLYDM